MWSFDLEKFGFYMWVLVASAVFSIFALIYGQGSSKI